MFSVWRMKDDTSTSPEDNALEMNGVCKCLAEVVRDGEGGTITVVDGSASLSNCFTIFSSVHYTGNHR